MSQQCYLSILLSLLVCHYLLIDQYNLNVKIKQILNSSYVAKYLTNFCSHLRVSFTNTSSFDGLRWNMNRTAMQSRNTATWGLISWLRWCGSQSRTGALFGMSTNAGFAKYICWRYVSTCSLKIGHVSSLLYSL